MIARMNELTIRKYHTKVIENIGSRHKELLDCLIASAKLEEDNGVPMVEQKIDEIFGNIGSDLASVLAEGCDTHFLVGLNLLTLGALAIKLGEFDESERTEIGASGIVACLTAEIEEKLTGEKGA